MRLGATPRLSEKRVVPTGRVLRALQVPVTGSL
jgi:hypothetical protein